MALSTFKPTSLPAQLVCHGQGFKNVATSSFFRTFAKPIKISSCPAVRRQRLQIRMLKGAGTWQPPEVAGFGSQNGGSKTKHKLKTLDPTKVEEVQTFNLFARKLAKDEPASKWEAIGEILVEKETDLELALKERRRKLLAAAQHQYPSFLMRSAGEEVQYGYRKAGEEQKENDVTSVDVKGKELISSIPALLRADDGVKPQPKRY